MNKPIYQHILFWIVIYFLWTFMKAGGIPNVTEMVIGIINVISYATVYYGLTKILIRRYYDHGMMAHFSLGLLLLSSLGILLWRFMIECLRWVVEVPSSHIPPTTEAYLLEAIQLYVPGFFLLAWESYTTQEKEEHRLHILEKEALSHELNYLKAKVNPTLILATLENLKNQVKIGSPEAPKMILELSNILDYVLYKSQHSNISINEEWDIVKSYINLILTNNQLNQEIIIKEDLSYLHRISPLTILAITQDVFDSIDLNNLNTARIHLISTEEAIQFELNIHFVRDSNKHQDLITQIEKQLKKSYPGKHNLKIQLEDKSIKLSLNISTSDE